MHVEHEMAMAEAAPSLAIIDWSIITIVICVVEEPVGDAASCADVYEFETRDSNEALSPYEGQPKVVIDEIPA